MSPLKCNFKPTPINCLNGSRLDSHPPASPPTNDTLRARYVLLEPDLAWQVDQTLVADENDVM